MIFLKVGIILFAYIVIKGLCVAVNESEGIRFNVPKILERASLCSMAFLSQVIFF